MRGRSGTRGMITLQLHGLAAGRQSDENLRQPDRRPRLLPALPGRTAGDFSRHRADIRNQYSISYHPTNAKLDGTYRKLKVELQAPDGGPLKVHDQKGKEVKYIVYAREGYTAKHTVE
jgi:hypothetical protein